jgi:hypothetical protein
MMDDEGEARLKSAVGENYRRLAALKVKDVPKNFFRVNQNIRPGRIKSEQPRPPRHPQ